MMGRPVSTWQTRKCRTCGVVYPRPIFEFINRSTKTGWSTRPDCRYCFRRRERELKLREYQTNEVYRQYCIESNRRSQKFRSYDALERAIEFSCRWAWIDRKRDQIMILDSKPIIICVKPKDINPRRNERPSQRRGKTLGFILDKPPVEIPIGWIPILRKHGAIITKHPSCPAEWEWTEHILELRYRAWHGQQNTIQNESSE